MVVEAPPRPPKPPAKTNAITAYAMAITTGEVLAGQLVRHACERHLRDLERDDLVFDEVAAERAIAFFGHLRQSKGRWAGQPLILQPWQAFVVGSIFGWKRADTGLRRFRDAYVSVARKQGKTTLAAGVGLYLLAFDREPGAEVYAAATKRDQARICWNEAARMVRKTQALSKNIRIVDSRANMHVLDTASKFEALGADQDSMDGLNVHGAIIDELHAHKNRAVVDALETGAGAREQPLFLYITTAGLERESIYSETDDYARRVVDGSVADDGWFVYIAQLDKAGDNEDDWTDSALYGKSNPSLGVTIKPEELEAERDRALEVPGRVNVFKRLRLNLRTGQFSAWFTPEQWEACRAEFSDYDLEGKDCFAGLDLASTTDVSALVLVFPNAHGDGADYLLPYFWLPEQASTRRWERDRVPYPTWIEQGFIKATDGNITDYDVIREDIRVLAERFNIREIAYDRWNATQLITQLMGDGATCAPIGQGFQSMNAPSKSVEAKIGARRVRHNGNPALRWMVLNAQKQEDPAGNIKPARDKSADKIDGLMAWLDAEVRLIAHGEEPESEAFFV